MLKKFAVWTVLIVASVLAVQVLLRKGSPSSSIFEPPKIELPALDPP
jgi:hypothetical protein